MTSSAAKAQIWDDFTVWYDGNGADSGHITEVRYKSGTNDITLKENIKSADGRDVPYARKYCQFLGWSLDPAGNSVITPIIAGGTKWDPVDVPVTWDENKKGFVFYARWDCSNSPIIISPTATQQPEEPNPESGKPTQQPMLILAPDDRLSSKENPNSIQTKDIIDPIETDSASSAKMIPLKFTSDISDLPYLPDTGITGKVKNSIAKKPASVQYKPANMELQIPSLGVTSDIVFVDSIDNYYPVEWLGMDSGLLEGTSLPGEGFSVIAGHNTLSSDTLGPFALIFSMEIGDHFFIRREDNKLMIFEIFSNEKISKYDFESLYKIGYSCDNTVTLLTCEDEQTEGGYASRRIVTAKMIQ